MKELAGREVTQDVDFSRLFFGLVESVSSKTSMMEVALVDVPGVVSVPVPFGYIAGASTSFMLFMPKKGDGVLLAQRNQALWEVVAMRPIVVQEKGKEESGLDATTWASMLKTTTTVKPMELKPGDFGIQVCNSANVTQFFMLTDGSLLMSAGATYFLMNQAQHSIKQIFSYGQRTNGKMTEEFGEVRKTVAGNPEPVIPEEHLWAIKLAGLLGNEELAFGFVNSSGVAEYSSGGGKVRFRVKAGRGQIEVDSLGQVEIEGLTDVVAKTTLGSVRISDLEILLSLAVGKIKITDLEIAIETAIGQIKITDDEITLKTAIGEVKVSDSEITLNTAAGELALSDSDCTINVPIKVARGGEVGGKLALCTELLLTLLSSHTHTIPTGMSGTSAVLANLDVCKTLLLKAG